MIAFRRRAAFSLLELLVVIAIVWVLFGFTLAAVQRARGAASRLSCANNLKQIGLASTQYHDVYGHLPAGVNSFTPTAQYPFLGWEAQLLPFLEQENLWQVTVAAFQKQRFAFYNPPHIGLATVLPVFICPSDARTQVSQKYIDLTVALTSYLGNTGTNGRHHDGLFWMDSAVPFLGITDGLSNTLLVGERPPSPEFRYGWWYAGAGQNRGSGSLDSNIGTREINLARLRSFYNVCPSGPYHYQPGELNNYCDVFHYWSLHDGGANFVFADGSVHFLSYSADDILPALGTRAGGEVAELP